MVPGGVSTRGVLTLVAGVVLLVAAGVALLIPVGVVVLIPDADADTRLGAGILLVTALVTGAAADLLIIMGLRRSLAGRPAVEHVGFEGLATGMRSSSPPGVRRSWRISWRQTAVAVALLLVAGAGGGLEGIVEAFAGNPARVWKIMIADPTSLAVAVLCAVGSVVGLAWIVRELRRVRR